MTQATKPTADTVQHVINTLLRHGTNDPTEPGIRPVATGNGRSAWWVGNHHVLRLAPDRQAALRQRREPRLRDLVRPHLPVTVPAGVAHGEWAPGLTYTLDIKVPVETEQHNVSTAGEDDLAGVLIGLRRVSVRQTEGIGVPRVAPRPLQALLQAADWAVERLGANDEFDPTWLQQLTGPAAVRLADRPGATVLVHRALTGEHVAVGADGRVHGILGWGNAAIGDPCEDIAALAAAVGAPVAVRAATLAGYSLGSCLRGLWLARCDAVIRLAEALESADAGRLAPLRVSLRHAWEAILLERLA
ncbi:aminoglycoside phosphotransferase (APT) family kinase protein [Streptomyces sp. SAI-135]|uniref:phosphotransferase family protein n=1 Tax=unclassified Streptomyces TaxID=2593676 RepID=UPI0024751829|nr:MULTISPECIES: aminoglycoside phosphotransferase family protein [unclassified Streptomyces]MDH6522989.1 aminoglycoside phosphotransferase (APT) family kinase protein [Streptomyces sp. SAI-090]MDH6554608.1 aminoglycoside phosphotransferase (APT) family kinase protein [Streptomyces sp. SAI-041]MDH6573872.1 aminoglycoside phosphotransferase (APT) family kinase protein [Streptomyces sp. SAI-117]MDH6581392.1 aminoglycoside phosphotransferase (APT) family kinase protein [Streptomyces sp. SAI-133]M